MPVPIPLPELGTDGEEIRVSCWLVEPGEAVETGDRVVEVKIAGVTFDVPAPMDGVIGQIEKPIEAVVEPGEALGWMEPGGSSAEEEP